MKGRLGRIFREDGRSLIIPIDHGLSGPIMPGWEDPAVTLHRVIEGGPDGILTSFGVLKQYREIMAGKVATLLRLDGWATQFQEERHLRWPLLYTVEDALRLGADGVIVVGHFGAPCELETIQTIARVASDCQKWDMPLAVEPLPFPGPRVKNVRDAETIAGVTRVAAELGADFIKTYYTGSAESFCKVTSYCPVPVLIAGGPRMETDRDVLETVHGMLEGGGKGIFFGRNVWQHRDPTGITRALRRIIHEGASVDTALEELRGR